MKTKTKTKPIGDISAYLDTPSSPTDQDMKAKRKEKIRKIFRGAMLLLVAAQIVALIILQFR